MWTLFLRRTFSLYLLLALFSGRVSAVVDVAFFEGYQSNGQRVELTPGGRFFHTAIKIEGVWYHTSSNRGVIEVKDFTFSDDLRLAAILRATDFELTLADIKPYLGLPFDFSFDWDRIDSTYCCKFIAQLIGVNPRDMTYSSDHWGRALGVSPGQLGVSPDYLHSELLRLGFVVIPFDKNNLASPLCKSIF